MQIHLIRGKVTVVTWSPTSRSYTVGDVTVTPQAHAAAVRLPFATFGWVRPAAVLVQRGGRTERLAIRNVTRIWQVGVTVLGGLLGVAARYYMQQRKDQTS